MVLSDIFIRCEKMLRTLNSIYLFEKVIINSKENKIETIYLIKNLFNKYINILAEN